MTVEQSALPHRVEKTPATKSHATNTETAVVSPNPSKAQGVIDLTADSDDIQKAIAASLQDNQGILGGQVSREEQDISRVLEASLAESKAGTKRKRGDIWFVDPLNPHERKRQDGCPVGLKNVGNTCWFSAVIQSLFHLRRFRHLVLNFRPSCESLAGTSIENRNLRFMQELRYLFALMVSSRRKYVDPSKAVEILKEAFSSPTGITDNQQDVSEFQHKLLEWLEDAFRTDHSRSASPSEGSQFIGHDTSANKGIRSARCLKLNALSRYLVRLTSPTFFPRHVVEITMGASNSTARMECSRNRNPMVELFYGQYSAEGVNEGKCFTNQETFGQFPLQVNGFRDIHESLQAATVQDEIEAVSTDVTQKSGQELWFNRLPPVLTFELSRFQFNQQLGRPEKIHNKIEFPRVIFMDRYLGCNKHETRLRREQEKKLKEKLQILHSKLDKFVNYGSGPKRFPLQDVLLYALEFAQSRSDDTENTSHPHDVEMESPKMHASMQTNSPPKSQKLDDPMTPPRQQVSPPLDMRSCPSPRQVSGSELETLQSCLRRWRTEVESDVRELQENISRLEGSLNKMYSDAEMQQCPYQLHAVLVHEGQAASGHYWAYIYDTKRLKWLKFNDISVSETSWEELEKESMGGYHNASAYCLMYINRSRADLVEACDDDEFDGLPVDLQDLVQEDNDKFAKEIEDWDTDLAMKAASEVDASGLTEPRAGSASYDQIVDLPVLHAGIALRETTQAVSSAIDSEVFTTKGATFAFLTAVTEESQRLDNLSKIVSEKLPMIDVRLQHLLVYLKYNKAGSDIIKKVLFEQFACISMFDNQPNSRDIRLAAVKQLELLRRQNSNNENYEKITLRWHEKFHQFRQAVYLLIMGLDAFHSEKYAEALPYLRHAYHMNSQLVANGSESYGICQQLLSFFQRECMLNLNDIAAHQFENEADIAEALVMMNELVLPCLPALLQTGNKEDTGAAEEIREKWCCFLGQKISDEKVEKLQDFLSKLFEPPSEMKMLALPTIHFRDMCNLYERYINVMTLINECGYIERAAKCQ